VFPHHENENAISMAATGSILARQWMHCDTVLYSGLPGGDTMEAITLSTLDEMGWSPRVVRFWLLSTHYTKVLHLSEQALNEAKLSLKRFDRCFQALAGIRGGEDGQDLDQVIYDIKQGFSAAMDDDLKITDVVALLFRSVKKLNRLMDLNRIDAGGAEKVLTLFKSIDSVLNIFQFEAKQESASEEAAALIKQRELARKNRQWDLADQIRKQLNAMGVESHDKKV